MSKKLIQALEPRIMLDGAAVATAIDVFDELNQDQQQQQEQSSKTDKFKTEEGTKLPFVNVDSSAQQTRTKQIAFIDSAVQDFEILANSFDENTEVHIIQSNEDGFETIENILSDQSNFDAIHIIGHGSAGQIAFGTALLNNVSLENYRTTLTSIGNSLTSKGDILFYGCNIANGQTGEILIKQISEITNADISASDDVTGKGGDWDLEKHTGIIEARNIEVVNYQHSLITGVDEYDSSVVVNDASNVNFNNSASGGYRDPSSDRFVLVQERADVTSGTGTLSFDVSGSHSSYTPSSDNPVHVYMLFSNDDTDGNSRRSGSRTGVVTFDNAIIGVFTTPSNTIAMSGVSQASGTFPTSGSNNFGKRDFEFSGNAAGPGSSGSKDWFAITNSNKTIEVGSKNGAKGDFIRIITAAPASNTAPVARNDAGYINEDATLSVANGANANDTTPDASGEYTGDVINTSSSTHADTDADGDTLTVTSIRTGSSENNGTAGSLGSYLPGTYGSLRIYANGSYDYIANDDDADALDPGDTVTDSFNYTISDGNGGTDHAVITITIAGVNDDITAVNDTDAVNEDATITRSTSDSQELDHDDTDPDGDDASGSFTITAIRTKRESDSDGNGGTVGQALSGTYGVLTVESDGSYEYVASTSGADGLTAGATAVDYFTYTVRDHNSGDTDTAELAITVTGVGPQAVADTGAVNENATLTVNEASGVIANDDDNASYDSESLAVTSISSNGTSNSGNAAAAVTGTYGVLTMAADGSYQYVANTAAAEALDASDEVTDVFTYTLKDDADVNSSTATLTITVTGVDDNPVGVDDTGAVNEDKTLSVSAGSGVLSNDTDADDSSSISVSAITGGTVGQAKNGTYGVLTLNSNGSYSYVANGRSEDGLAAGATATDTFEYTVSDGAGTTDTASLTITVTGVGPLAVNDTGAVNEDATLTVNEASGVISNDDDNASYDSESLAVTNISSNGTSNSGNAAAAVTGTYGVLTMAADGSYEYVANQNAADALDPGDTVTDVFTYTLKDDADKNSSTATLTITVTGINDDITAVNDTDAVNAGSTISRSTSDTQELDHDDTDPDADDVSGSFTITSVRKGTSEGSGDSVALGQAVTTTYGTITVNADGSYTYAADQTASTNLGNGVTATDSFNYTVRDHNSGDTDIATLVITITGTSNTAPVASNDTGYIVEDGTLTVSDGGSAVTGSDSNNNNQSGDNTGDVLVGDTDEDDDSLTVSGISGGSVGSAADGTYGQLTIQSNGSYVYVANKAAADALDDGDTATDVFTYTISDGNNGSDTATITITVVGIDDDPVGVNDTGAVNEDATLSVNSGSGVLSNDTDADDSSSLTVSAISGGTVGQALTGTYGTLTLNSNGSYSYVANTSGADGLAASATATDTFTYTVSDGAGTTDTATLTVTVTGVGPQAVADTGAVNENATLTVNEASGVIANDDDNASYDSESLAVTSISSNGTSNSGNAAAAVTGTYGVLTMAADGSYQYVANTAAAEALDASDEVTDVFTYTLKDDADVNSSTATLTITVTGVNDDIIAVDDTDSVNEDATITRTVSDAQELDADDTDVDTDDVQGSFTITAIRTGTEAAGTGTGGTIGQALPGTYGTLTVNADGSYTYVADQDAADNLATGATATDVFTYTVSDGTDTDTAQITITVTGINDNDPVAVNDTDTVNRDATISRDAGSAYDIDSDDTDADNDSLSITEIRVGQSEGGGRSGDIGSALTGQYGTLTLNSNGSYTYAADNDSINTLKRGESVIEYFNYTVSDGTNTDTAVIAITINGISDPPVPIDDTLAIDAGVTATKEGSESLVSNDTDPDGDTLTVDSIRTGQESGTGTTGTIGSPLTGTYGDITVNQNGSYTYDANNAKSLNPGETVTEYFTYTATDTETSVPAQITITVTGVNDPPEVTNPITVPTLFTGQKLVIRHPQAFNDPDSGSFDIQTYTVIDPETEQETTLPEGLDLRANKLTGRPTTPGTYSITLRATDGGGLYVDHTFTFTVITRPGEKSEKTEEPIQTNEVVKVRPKKDNQPMKAEPKPIEPVIDEGFTLDTVKIADTASLSKPLKFNGGLRLMDAIADTYTSSEDSDLKIGVKINDDNQKNVELYSGKLSDGRALPNWIKVDPETGETTAEMPDNMEQVEVQLVALDKDGNTRDISIVLDKAKIKNDKSILRTGEMNETRMFVDSDSNVNVIRENDGKVNETASNNLNANADFIGNLRLSDVRMDDGKYVLNIIDDNQSNVKSYTAVMKDGEALPSWISIDPKTGAISVDPSKNINNSSVPSFIADAPTVLELKIVAEDEDGKERVIDVEVNLEELTTEQTDTEESNEESEEISFVPLQDQINQQIQQSDNYGEEFISRVG